MVANNLACTVSELQGDAEAIECAKQARGAWASTAYLVQLQQAHAQKALRDGDVVAAFKQDISKGLTSSITMSSALAKASLVAVTSNSRERLLVQVANSLIGDASGGKRPHLALESPTVSGEGTNASIVNVTARASSSSFGPPVKKEATIADCNGELLTAVRLLSFSSQLCLFACMFSAFGVRILPACKIFRYLYSYSKYWPSYIYFADGDCHTSDCARARYSHPCDR